MIVVKAYRFLNLLSIDIAAGAIACALFFARLLDVEMRVAAIVSLGLTVWIIYTVDHLMDAKKIEGRASTERHRFHQDHFKVLVLLTIIAILVNAILIFFIKRPVLYSGVVIIALIGFYLLLHTRLAFLKEVFVAMLYCVGVLLPSVAVTSVSLTTIHYLFSLAFFFAALINLLLFSWFDRERDKMDGRTSFVTHLGEQITIQTLYFLVIVNMMISIYLAIASSNQVAAMVPLLMTLALAAILRFRTSFAKDDRYRLLGDAVFLLCFFVV
jgi:4-hydroxybenzoate polyprenyltransferase